MISKEDFLNMFQKCIEEGDIVIGLEKEYAYDNDIIVYPTISIYRSMEKENYDSGEKFRCMAISIRE